MQLYDSFLHLCKMSALWNSIPKRSIHHGEESLGISLEAWTAGSLWRSTWIPMQNDVVNQSCCFFLPPSKKFVFTPEEVYNGEPTFSELYRERLLVSLKLGCRHCQSFAISTKKKRLIWRVAWFSFQRDGRIVSNFLHLFTEGKSCKFLPDS